MRYHYPIVPSASFPQAQFDPQVFRADVVNFAGGCPNIRWERYFPCPCLAKFSLLGTTGFVGGENDHTCTNCGGTGAYWRVQPDTYGIITNRGAQVDKNGKLTGTSWNDVTARFTLLPENAPAHNDRLTVLNDYILVHELRKLKTKAEPMACRFPIAERHVISANPAQTTETVCNTETVVELSWSNSDGEYQGALEIGTDVIVDGGKIDFSASSVDVGSYIVVTYWAHPRYVVVGHTYISRAQPTPYPGQLGTREEPAQTEMPVAVNGQLELVGLPAGAPAPTTEVS